MPKKQKIPARPRSKPLSPEAEDALVTLLASIPVTADGQLDWREIEKDRPAEYKVASDFLWREVMWVDRQVRPFVQSKGGSVPYVQRSHTQSHHEGFVDDYVALRGNADEEYQQPPVLHEDDDDHEEDLVADAPEPTDSYWADIQSELPAWIRKAAGSYDSTKGLWRPWLQLCVETRIQDFLNRGKRDPKGKFKCDEPAVAGMVDRAGDEPDLEQLVYGWIEDRDLEGIFLLAEVEAALEIHDPEDRAIALALLTNPRAKYVDLGKPFDLNGDQARKRMAEIRRRAPAIGFAEKLVKLVYAYLDQPRLAKKREISQRLAGFTDAIRIYYGRDKHQTPGFRQGPEVQYTRTGSRVKKLTHLMAGRDVAPPFGRNQRPRRGLSKTPALPPPNSEPTLSPACWYPDKPQTIETDVQLAEVRITDLAAPLYRLHVDALLRLNPYPGQPIPEQDPAPNHGEHCARAIDLNDRIDPEPALLKLKNKAATKNFTRQLAASTVRATSEWSGVVVKRKPELPRPTPSPIFETWSIQPTNDFTFDKLNTLVWEICAIFYNAPRCIPQHEIKVKGSVKVKRVGHVFRGEAFACPTAKRSRIREEGIQARSKRRPVTLTLARLSYKGWRREQPQEQYGPKRPWPITGSTPWAMPEEQMRGVPLRDGYSSNLATTPSWLFEQPGEMQAAKIRLANKSCWMSWTANNDFAQAKYPPRPL
jgi:hypothetical protein